MGTWSPPNAVARGGRTKDRSEPERRCIATGSSGPKAGLIRFVAGPEGTVVPDLAQKLPGRGMWVAADRAALTRAVSKNLFARSAKASLRPAADLADVTERLLAHRIVSLLALARKAGQAVAGAQKVKDALVAEELLCLLQAEDGSAREKAALRPPPGDDTYFADLTSAEMGLAFGRERVIHAGLFPGGLGAQVRYESARLHGFRAPPS